MFHASVYDLAIGVMGRGYLHGFAVAFGRETDAAWPAAYQSRPSAPEGT